MVENTSAEECVGVFRLGAGNSSFFSAAGSAVEFPFEIALRGFPEEKG